ncbi:zinc ribbon domain-containing protein [Orrella marina]|uniref:zinc ribbon domain-containing protein n=1 Tax=Orrella marina TaxID=2163011 RepID=UPI001D131B41|nr:zinc ribbon domain-containing protein [Orrella marina]
MVKPKSKTIPWPILGIVYACLLFAMYISLSTLVLGFWGQTTVGTIDSYESRLDNRNAGENRSRTVSKGYHFTVNGKGYRGYVIYLSDESWPRLSAGETRTERISYLPVFPYINKPGALVEFSKMGELAIAYHFLAPFGYLFLLLLVSRTVIRQRKKSQRLSDQSVKKPMAASKATEITCSACGRKLPGDAQFCSGCGASTKRPDDHSCHSCG